MDTELEVKFYGINKDDLRTRLKKVGAKLVEPERKMRRAIYDEMFHQGFKCDFIRIRDEGTKVTLSAKTHQHGGKIEDEKETVTEIGNYDKAVEIFSAMGYEPDRYQETLRESWQIDDCEIDIDTWPGLDTFCEIESDSEEKIKLVSEKLGFDWKYHIVSNAMSMYLNVYQLPKEQSLKLAENLTFESNPFAKFTKHDYNYEISK